MKETLRSEDRALRAALLANIVLTVLGVVFALLTGSDAILLDGVYSFTGVLVSLFTIYVARVLRQPESEEFPFGFAPLEPLLNMAKGLLILAVSGFALFSAITSLLSGGRPVETGIALIYAVVATVACLATWLSARRLAAHSGSHLVAVDADSWMLDALISGVIAVGFGVAILLEHTPWSGLIPYADPALVVVLILSVLVMPFRIIRDAYRQLIGAIPADTEVESIRGAVRRELSAFDRPEHKLRLFRVGRMVYVQLYVILRNTTDRGPTLDQQDALRAGLFEFLRVQFPYVALDVVFTGDPAWSNRSVGTDQAQS